MSSQTHTPIRTTAPAATAPSAGPSATGRLPARRVALALAAALAVSVALDTVVARIAVAAGASAGFPPLTMPVHAGFALVGILLGWIGFRVVQHRSADPARTLRWLVPVVAALSFIPDVALGVIGFIPGTSWAGVLGLMAMHPVVIAAALPAYVVAARGVRAAA